MNSVANRIHHPGLWQQPQEFGAVTPLITQEQQVLAAIEALSTSKKWITLIGMPSSIEHRELLQTLLRSGVDRSRIRWVQHNDEETLAWAAEQALLLDNSELVIAWLGQCQGRNLKRAELAAKVSHAKAFLFTSNKILTPLH